MAEAEHQRGAMGRMAVACAVAAVLTSAGCASEGRSAAVPTTTPTARGEPSTTTAPAVDCSNVAVVAVPDPLAAPLLELIRSDVPDLAAAPELDRVSLTELTSAVGVLQASFRSGLEPAAWTVVGLDTGDLDLTARWSGQGSRRQVVAALAEGAPDGTAGLFECVTVEGWFISEPPATDDWDRYVGTDSPPEPRGAIEHAGGSFDAAPAGDDETYGYRHWESGSTHVLLFGRGSLDVDVIAVELVEIEWIDNDSCEVDGGRDPYLVAVVDDADQDGRMIPSAAWHFEVTAEQAVEVDPTTVSCEVPFP